MSFKQKIFICYLAIFVFFALLLYPVASALIGRAQQQELKQDLTEKAHMLGLASSLEDMIQHLGDGTYLLFDIGLEHLYPPQGEKKKELLELPEVREALDREVGYAVRFSPKEGEERIFVAATFFFQGELYILQQSFPSSVRVHLRHHLAIVFLLVGLSILFLFGVISWSIVISLTRPIHEIIYAIAPYQKGREERIPEIRLTGKNPASEFQDLAETFNSLSKKIEAHIHTLKQEKNEKSAILESLIEGVVAVDQDMNIIYLNKTAEVFLGKRASELAGQKFGLTGERAYEELLEEAKRTGVPAQLIFKPEAKKKRVLDAIAIPRGRNEGAILVLQDKTSLYKILELGREFIANASHELKTPITIIRGFAETLHDHPELSPEVYQEITGKIVSNCQRMDTLVKNLLTLAALDEGLPRSRLHECDLVDLVEQAMQTVLAVHPGAEITIETRGEEPFQLPLDSDLFLQAILNLLDNAVKYSKAPAKVAILIERRGGEFVISVEDQGIGIPQEDLDRVFDRFYAVDKSRSRALGGSGLGLSIVVSILEKMHGKIDVDSTLGKGSTFRITLPIPPHD